MLHLPASHQPLLHQVMHHLVTDFKLNHVVTSGNISSRGIYQSNAFFLNNGKEGTIKRILLNHKPIPPIKNSITCQIPTFVFPAMMLPKPGRNKKLRIKPMIAIPLGIFSLFLFLADILVTLYFCFLCFLDFTIFPLFDFYLKKISFINVTGFWVLIYFILLNLLSSSFLQSSVESVEITFTSFRT